MNRAHGNVVATDRHGDPSSARTLWLAEATGRLEGLEFDEILARAPGLLARVTPTATLTIGVGGRPPDGAGPRRGPVASEGTAWRWEDFYLGPPEPVWLTVAGEERADEPLAAVFLAQLRLALAAAGYASELPHHSRRDWLTCLPQREALERRLDGDRDGNAALGLVLLEPRVEEGAYLKEAHDLAVRDFAQALQRRLRSGEQAYLVGPGLVGVLAGPDAESRLQLFLGRQGDVARSAWVNVRGVGAADALRLARERLDADGPADAPRTSLAPTRLANERVDVLCGLPLVKQLLEATVLDWRFTRPVTLVMDLPVGYAFEVVPTARRPVLVACHRASTGYLLDMVALVPDGLMVGKLTSNLLRSSLQKLALGQMVYSGPALDLDQLFPRERQVWRLVATGLDNAAIAARLGISSKTVANYVNSGGEKLGLRGRTELALAYWGLPLGDEG